VRGKGIHGTATKSSRQLPGVEVSTASGESKDGKTGKERAGCDIDRGQLL